MNKEELDWLSILMQKTGVFARDCIVFDDSIIFVLNHSDTGKVIGRGGETIRHLRVDLGREVEIIVFSDSPEEFANNTIAPVRVIKKTILRTDDHKKTHITLVVAAKDRGRAIGRNRRILNRSQTLLKRHFNIDTVRIISHRDG